MSLFNFFQKKEYSIGIVPGKETQKMLDKRDDETIYLFLKYLGDSGRFKNSIELLVHKHRDAPFKVVKMFLNPGVIGVCIGLLLFLTPLELPHLIFKPIQYLAALNTPLPMVVVGFYLSGITSFAFLKDLKLLWSLVLRLVIVPLLSLIILYAIGKSTKKAAVSHPMSYFNYLTLISRRLLYCSLDYLLLGILIAYKIFVLIHYSLFHSDCHSDYMSRF